MKSKTPKYDELVAARARVVEIKARYGQIERDRASLAARLQDARDRLSEFHSAAALGTVVDGGKSEAELADELRALESEMQDTRWQERVEGVRRAERKAQEDVSRFCVENLEALSAEATAVATATHADVLAALSAADDAINAYISASSMWTAILGPAGIQGRVPMYDDVHQVRTGLERLRSRLRVLVPSVPAGVTD